MTKTTYAAALAAAVMALAVEAPCAQAAAPVAAALSPYTATRLGRHPRDVRKAHCEKKADSVGVHGKAREIYMRKCGNG